MLKSFRHLYWLVQEFVKRHHTLIIRTVGVVLFFSLFIAAFIRYLPSPRIHTRIGLVGKYTPETLPLVVRQQVSFGLVKMDEQGEPHPALAKAWSVSEDGKKYRFILDESLRWHGGSKIKPEDITYNFQDVKLTTDKESVTFLLNDPFAPFFYAVSRPLLKNGRLGLGEFTIAKSTVFSGIVQSIVLISDRAKLTYKFYPTETSALTAFKLGEVDRLESLSYVPSEIKDDPTTLLSQNHNYNKLAVVFFNNRDSLLSSKSTRQALAYAIKNKDFNFTRATSPIPASSWAFNPLVKNYRYDPTHARSLLSQDVKSPGNIKLELKTMLQYLDVAEEIANDWRTVLGIQVDVKVVTNLSSDYQALLADYTPPADPDQYTIWHSTQPGNFTHYANLKVDKLLEDGRRTMDKKIRKDIYHDFQRFLLEDSPAVFLFQTTTYNLSRKGIPFL